MTLFKWIKNFFGLVCSNYRYSLLLFSFPLITYFSNVIGEFNTGIKRNNINEQSKIWKLQFTEQSINSISIIFNEDFNPIISFKFDGWKSVEKVYVNNVETEIASLYMGSDFFYKKNNVFYSIVDNRRCDSIVYKFPPNDKIEIYDANKKLLKIEKNCFQSKELYNIYNSFFIK